MFKDKGGSYTSKFFVLVSLIIFGTLIALTLIVLAHDIDTPFCTTTGNYNICSDKDDYAPSSIVHISGNGFSSAIQLTLKVTRPDGSVVTGDGSFAPWPTEYDNIVTDSYGQFQYDYVLDGINGQYLVEVLDESGNVVATHSFLDARFINSVTLNGSKKVIVPPGAKNLTALVNVTTTDSGSAARWRCVSYKIQGQPTIEVDFEPDHDSAGTFTETFNINNSPTSPGIYTVNFTAYNDDSCSGSPSGNFELNNSINVTLTTLTVNKVLIPSNDPAKFNLTIDGVKKAGNVGDSGTTGAVNVTVGVHTVGETAGAGTDLNDYTTYLSGDCAADGTVTLVLGDNKACNITNVRKSNLTVNKIVINNNGGTKVVSDFSLFVSGNPVTSGALNVLPNGTYVISETNQNGYAASFSGDCDSNGNANLTPGSKKVCNITNDDIAPKLTVTKIVTNNNGGTKVVGDFQLFVDNNSNQVISSVQNTFNAGIHRVFETNQSGYSSEISGDCLANGSISLALGDVKECIITNDDIAPKLTVTKIVVNDNGGTLQISDVNLFINDTLVNNGTQNTLNAGIYRVNETNIFGYASSFAGDCDENGDVQLGLGDVKECIITNDDISPKLTVTKYFINDNGGTLQIGDVHLFINNTEITNGTQNNINAGVYMVNETNVNGTNVSGYKLNITGDCSANGIIILNPGDIKACTITNDDIPSKIIITKWNDTNGDGTRQNDEPPIKDWQVTLSKVTQEASIINPIQTEIVALSLTGADGSVPFNAPTTGHYIITEESRDGYVRTYPVDSFFDVFVEVNGQTITQDNNGNELSFGNHKLALLSQEEAQNIGTSSVNIFWVTDIQSTSRVVYDTASHPILGAAPNYGYAFSTLENETKVTEHSVSISGLTPFTTYYYRTISRASPESVSQEFNFSTLAEPASIRVIKDVLRPNANQVNDTHYFTVRLNGSNQTVSESFNALYAGLSPGNYTVTEDADSDYDFYFFSQDNDLNNSNGAQITVGSGENVTLVVYNLQKLAKITIQKNVIAPDGSEATDEHLFFAKINGSAGAIIENILNATIFLEPGIYNISEDFDQDYEIFSISNDDNSNVDDGALFDVSSGENLTIIVTNKQKPGSINIHKQVLAPDNNDANDSRTFTVRLNGSNPLIINEGLDAAYGALKPGNYSVTEDFDSDYEFLFFSADNDGDDSNGAQLTVTSNANAELTIFNRQKFATVTVQKNVTAPNGSDAFDDHVFAVSINQSQGIAIDDVFNATFILNPGIYNISEGFYDDYDIVSISNDDNLNASDGALFSIGSNQNLTIIVTNRQHTGSIIVSKDVLNPIGAQTSDSHSFTIKLNGENSTPTKEGLDAIYGGLEPGVYTITENDDTDYSFDFFSADNDGNPLNGAQVAIMPGKNTTLVIHNRQKFSEITVVKDAMPDDSQDFEFVGNASTFLLDDDNTDETLPNNTTFNVPPGIYNITEIVPENWISVMSCNETNFGNIISLSSAESVLCNFTNIKKANLTVTKIIVNDNGSTKNASDFQLLVDGLPVNSGEINNLLPGAYVISEVSHPGYVSTIGLDCAANGSINLLPGDVKNCTITNDDIAPVIRLIKNVVNDNGGNASPNDFNLKIDGTVVLSNSTTAVSANTPHIINETLLDGYMWASISGDGKCPSALGGNITLNEGENITCTITNDDIPSTIFGIKFEDKNGDGNKGIGEQGVSGTEIILSRLNQSPLINGTIEIEIIALSLTGTNGEFNFTAPRTGFYRINETVPQGWKITYPIESFFDVFVDKNGLNFTKDINNRSIQLGNFKLSNITIHKNVTAADGFTDVSDSRQFIVKLNNSNPALISEEQNVTYSNLGPGNYTISEEPDSNYDLVSISPSEVNATSGSNIDVFIVNRQKPATAFSEIHGMKFNDSNGNGIKELGENGLKGWTIFLDINGNGVLDAGEPSNATNENGEYKFANLSSGNYTVREVLKKGWVQTAPADGKYDIILTNGQNLTGRDFGNFKLGRIQGTKFNDLNGNGIKDKGEKGLGGWRIFLDINNNGVNDTGEPSTLTFPSGLYSFRNLSAGTYHVREVLQDGWSQSVPASGEYVIEINSGTMSRRNNFGNFNYARLFGIKFNDLNANGTIEKRDRGLRNWTIYLDLNENGVLDITEPYTLTNHDGEYLFENLTPGNYIVQELNKSGWVQTSPTTKNHSVVIAPGIVPVSHDFGNFKLGKIRGSKFNDLNGNGEWNLNKERGLANFTVYLDLNNNGVYDLGEPSALTVNDGSFSFEGIKGGTYHLREVMQNGWLQTAPANGEHIININSGTISGRALFGNRRQR